MTNNTRSCHQPFEFHLDYANNIPIFLYCLGCLGFGSLFGYLLWRHKQSRAHLVRNFIMLINEDIFYFYLAMLFPGVSVLICQFGVVQLWPNAIFQNLIHKICKAKTEKTPKMNWKQVYWYLSYHRFVCVRVSPQP